MKVLRKSKFNSNDGVNQLIISLWFGVVEFTPYVSQSPALLTFFCFSPPKLSRLYIVRRRDAHDHPGRYRSFQPCLGSKNKTVIEKEYYLFKNYFFKHFHLKLHLKMQIVRSLSQM